MGRSILLVCEGTAKKVPYTFIKFYVQSDMGARNQTQTSLPRAAKQYLQPYTGQHTPGLLVLWQESILIQATFDKYSVLTEILWLTEFSWQFWEIETPRIWLILLKTAAILT